ncbi:acetolactate synthase large subunit, partial [Pseudonocardia sp. SCN 73-27]
ALADGTRAAARIAAATGATLLAETFPSRSERGGGLPAVPRLSYVAAAARRQLVGAAHLVLAGARSPVAFFGYPGRSGDLLPEGCEVVTVAQKYGPAATALAALADLVAPGTGAPAGPQGRPELPTGELTGASASAVIGALLPDGAIVVDEANTSGVGLGQATAGGPRHDWLTLPGGAIGYGMPAAAGAAVACPDRPVWCLAADGASMYTISALWTHAREGLDVTTVVYNNAAYAVLRAELAQVGAEFTGDGSGAVARRLLDLDDPTLDFVRIAQGMGVPARRATTAGELADALRAAAAEPGPHVVEAMVAPLVR